MEVKHKGVNNVLGVCDLCHRLYDARIFVYCLCFCEVALGNTVKSTLSITQNLVRYSHVRCWRSTKLHQRGLRYKQRIVRTYHSTGRCKI